MPHLNRYTVSNVDAAFLSRLHYLHRFNVILDHK